MLLAELTVRHTRRHMPTRRVSLDDGYLPTSGVSWGGVLLGAVVAEHVGELDEDQLDALDRLIDHASDGIVVPRIALRYRLQTDRHGLDRSRHRIVRPDVTGSPPVLELDRHGPPAPQVIASIMAASRLPSSTRLAVLRTIRRAAHSPGQLPEGLEVRRLFHGVPGAAPWAPGARRAAAEGGVDDRWTGVPAEYRWAMEVLGLHAGTAVVRDDVQQRFRRLIRLAHPDHGGGSEAAAQRIAELSEAREVLLSGIASAIAGGRG